MRDAASVGMKPLLFLAFLALGPALGDQISLAPGPLPGPTHGSMTASPGALVVERDETRAVSPTRERDALALSFLR